jgi:hypothetical protein
MLTDQTCAIIESRNESFLWQRAEHESPLSYRRRDASFVRLDRAQAKTAEAEKELRKVRELHEKEDSLVGKMSSSPPALNPANAR